MQRTLVAIKPDAVKRGLIGKIITKFEEKGYKIIGMKMLIPDKELAYKHYQEHIGKPFFDELVKFITSGPIVAMVLEGENVIKGVRHLMGSTMPEEAQVGTIRAEFAQVKQFNVVHGSDSEESAKREIDIYFKESELCTGWKTVSEIIMQDQ